jgi:propionate catabolism operon transcriptional regulator
LLRVLEEREVMRVGGTRPVPITVRVISATHCDLDARVREGRFRADLYYRLAVLRMVLPPLRERRADLPQLAEWALKNAMAGLSARPHPNLAAEIAACVPLLAAYAWPGNVRELRNLMERLALFLAAEPLQALTPAFLLAVAPELGRTAPSPAMSMPAVLASPQENAAEVLARFGGQRDAAARHLGISRTTLWRRLKGATPER